MSGILDYTDFSPVPVDNVFTIKKRLIFLLCFFYLSFFVGPILFGQGESIVFSHIDVNDGLSENWIKCMYRDSRGFMWFATNNGLNRFDGYKFETFRKEDSLSSAIPDNDVNVITEDNDGNLWIGTGGGISVLNNKTYKFTNINLVQTPPFRCPDIAYITAININTDGDILVGSHNGLFYINEKKNSVRQILIDDQACLSQLNSITTITSDCTGSFWIGTINGFIIKYNAKINTLEKFESYRSGSYRSGSITRLFADKNNSLWVGDQTGLHLFDISEGKWNLDFQKKTGLAFINLQISGIVQDQDNQMWISTDGNGLFIIDKDREDIINIQNTPYSEGSLSSNGIFSLYCDNSGTIWVGTSKKGIDFYKKNVRKFRLFRNLPTNSNSLNNNDVDCISEDSNGNILIGTNGGGLNFYNRKTQHFSHYFSQSGNPNSLSSNTIVSVFEDSGKKIWLGTYLGGLNCLDPKTGKIVVYRHSSTDSTTISDDRVWGIAEDSKKNMWFVTLTSGLNLLDRKTGKFRRFNTQNSPICFNYLNSIAIDDTDNLWLSSANGLIYYNPSQNRSKCYYNNPDNPASLSDNHIISTFMDSRGLFWVCTTGGLNLMDRKSESFRTFKESDGLPSKSILRILEDSNSDLWISTRNGLSRLTVSEPDVNGLRSFHFVNFGLSDGLQGREFNETSAYKTIDGELWFGGTDGINVFYPDEIMEDTASSKLVFTNLRIDNKVIRHGELVNKRVLLDKPIFCTDRIVLKYIENSFTLDFAALNYFYPDRNKYSYNLEGFNDKWISTEGRENFATFSNLPNGKYTFKLKCTNPDGTWNEKPLILNLEILPPFWKSWYAYAIYSFIIISVLAVLRYLTLYRERIKARFEQESLESRHIHEIDSLKIRFFTNISHEFRTPLTLILSPAEKLMSRLKTQTDEKLLNLISQNAKRLLLMVNQLLDFRKMEVQGFVYNPSLGDIIAFLRESVSSFNDLAEQKHIELVFSENIKELNTFFDKDKLEKIIFNLLSNAIKFTHVMGQIKVSVSPVWGKPHDPDNEDTSKPSHLEIKVVDSGIGIPEDKIANLFASFYQVSNSFSGDQGSGIGLALVKEFVKLHEGEISVESEEGKGSCFTVILPVVSNNNGLLTKNMTVLDAGDSSDNTVTLYDPKSGFSTDKPTLMIVEDNDDLRFYLKDNFQVKYNIYEASNGDEALAIILKMIPDLIISDVMMPGLNGIELCKRIREDATTSHIPVILLTGHSSSKKSFEFLETGADDCIMKPFNFQVLEAKISNLINIRRNLKVAFRNNISIEPGDISITSMDEQFIQKVLVLVEKNISNAEYTVEELSRDLGMSRTLLYKKIISLTGKSPLEFIRSFRLKRAAQLLIKSQLHVSEVAFKVGFNDTKYFRKHFKNEFGVIPSKYLEDYKSKKQL